MKVRIFILIILGSTGITNAQNRVLKQFKYDNGQVSSQGYMVEGNPVGYWKNFYPDGTLKSEGNRKALQLDSVWVFYGTNGNIYKKIEYDNGEKNGLLNSYYENGRLMSTEHYTHGVRTETRIDYYLSGSLKDIVPYDTLITGKEQGTGYEFDSEDGRIISIVQYRNGYLSGRERINRKDKFNQKQGLWKEFDEDYNVISECRYRNDKRNGYLKTYDKEGNLIETLKYVDGILIPDPDELAKLDIKKTYYPNAKVKSAGSYHNGVKEGVQRQYAENGVVTGAEIFVKGNRTGEGIVDAEGRRQGFWKEYFSTGELRSEGKYVNGKRIGKWVFYYADGTVEQEGTYVKGKPDGDWKWNHSNGNVWREESFYEGLEEGLAIEYNDTGKVVSQGEYLDGEREGPWILDIGDFREEGNYVAGQRDGIWKFYYPSGKLRVEGKFVQGKESGRYRYLYESGQTKNEGIYKFGLKEGDWARYDEEGFPTGTITYQQGEVVKVDGIRVGNSSGQKEN